MGAGWEDVVVQLRKRGFETEYYPKFNYDIYVKLMPTLDYYIYTMEMMKDLWDT